VTTRPDDLPEFKKPPVTEVVLSLQFATLGTLRSFHIGLLWERIRERYPTVEEQAELPPVFETFGSRPVTRQPGIQIETLLKPPMPRYWFEGQTGDLLQLQQDRLIHNWRQLEADQQYPRYEKVREDFVRDVTSFTDFIRDHELGNLRPNQSEISYVNTIDLPGSSNPQKALERIVKCWRGGIAIGDELESTGIVLRSVLNDEGHPYARMHIVVQPAFRTRDQTPIVRMDITVRGKPVDETIDAALAVFDRGREAIVRTFADITTPEMHEVWGRIK
jgi:uncharacterized protein (TIGR04255 family)